MTSEKKIIITGGHLTPAVALIDALLLKKWKIWYVGRKHSQEDDKSLSIEYKKILSYKDNVNLLSITTGKLQRYISLTFFSSFIKVPLGLVQSFYWLLTIKPNVVLSFGGYVALPVCFSAFILRIPIITHEQTRSPGLANKIIGKVAKIICITWPDTRKFFTSSKVQITGLPVRKAIFSEGRKIEIKLDKPLIYISGGSQGSHAINMLFEPILATLLGDFSIIHQCGSTVRFNDFQKFLDLKNNLPSIFSKRYMPLGYVEEDYLGWVYKHTNFAVARSGANTVTELALLGIPALFIPISWSASSEQYYNAKLYKDNGAGEILIQEKINSHDLLKIIYQFSKRITSYKVNAHNLKQNIIPDGTGSVASLIESIHN